MAFKEKISELTASESIISTDCIFTGNLITKGSIKIEGIVNGSISEAKEVFIGKTAKISGDISSERCIVYGSIKGNIIAKNLVEIMSTASVIGDITTQKIMVEEGAGINGMLKVKNQS